MTPYWSKSIYTKWVIKLRPQWHAWVITLRHWGHGIHVQLVHPWIGLLRQCRRTRVIERLASVWRLFLLHLRSSMSPQRQRNRFTTEELARAMGMLKCGYSERRVANVFGVSQSVISRAWNRFQMYGSATRRHSGKRGPISYDTGQTSSLHECDYSTKWVQECCWC